MNIAQLKNVLLDTFRGKYREEVRKENSFLNKAEQAFRTVTNGAFWVVGGLVATASALGLVSMVASIAIPVAPLLFASAVVGATVTGAVRLATYKPVRLFLDWKAENKMKADLKSGELLKLYQETILPQEELKLKDLAADQVDARRTRKEELDIISKLTPAIVSKAFTAEAKKTGLMEVIAKESIKVTEFKAH